MPPDRSQPQGSRRTLERAMLRVRWLGIVLGVFLTVSNVPNPGTEQPASAASISYAALGLLFVVNLAVIAFLRRPRSEARLAAFGAGVFAADTAAVWTIVWAYTFEPFSATWVILSVLALEGALRFQLWGAITPALLALPIEVGREAYRTIAIEEIGSVAGPAYFITNVTYRVGVLLMIGAVAGAIARNLERARDAAERRADDMHVLATQERAARRESAAFQHVILAGVSAEDLAGTLASMTRVIATELGYERVAVLLREGDTLRVAALHGFAPAVRARSVRVGEGIAGRVAGSGRAAIVPDVAEDPHYYCVDERTRSQISVPISQGASVIGVLHAESSVPGAFGPADPDRMHRLADQMALVIQNARLLAAERDTVERLQELDVMKSDFIAIASHELRTPLTAMQGSIKTLQRLGDRDPAVRAEMLAILDRQSDRLTRLVEDLLLTSRIDEARLELLFGSVDPCEVIGGVVRTVAEPGRIEMRAEPGIGRLVTDGQRLDQIVRNLVENALKFSPPDTPVLVTARPSDDGVAIDVADRGPGIPPEERKQIFEPFHQVGGSMRRAGEGLGLGLFIAERLTRALGGSIELESSGGGTRFRVVIPSALPVRSEIA